MWTAVLSWVFGGGLSWLGKLGIDLYKTKLDAENNSEHMVADLARREVDANAKLLVAEQGNIVTRWVRPAFATPFVVYAWKLVIWDMVLGLGSTDPLPLAMQDWAKYIIGGYFLGRSFEKVAQLYGRKG